MSARRARILVCLGVVWFAWVGPLAVPARAATVMVSLKYAAAPGCPDATDFKATVIARLGYDPFSEDAPEHVLVQIRARGTSLDGRIEWRDSQGQWAGDQRFPPGRTTCLQLVRAMGFALALQIQFLAKADAPPPAAVGTVTEKPPPVESPPKPPAAPPETVPTVIKAPEQPPAPPVAAGTPPPLPTPTRPAGPVFAVGTGPAVGLGLSSSPVLLGRVFGALAWERLSIELAVVMSVPSVTRRADHAGISQQYLLISAASCGARSRWKACLLLNVGEVLLVGRDIDRPASAAVPLVEAGARVAVVQTIGPRLFLEAHADGMARLTRWIGRLDQVPVWTAPRFAGMVGIVAGVRFP